MSEAVTILEAERLNKTAIVVGLSDGTSAVYVVEQLRALQPVRMATDPQDVQAGLPDKKKPFERSGEP